MENYFMYVVCLLCVCLLVNECVTLLQSNMTKKCFKVFIASREEYQRFGETNPETSDRLTENVLSMELE